MEDPLLGLHSLPSSFRSYFNWASYCSLYPVSMTPESCHLYAYVHMQIQKSMQCDSVVPVPVLTLSCFREGREAALHQEKPELLLGFSPSLVLENGRRLYIKAEKCLRGRAYT